MPMCQNINDFNRGCALIFARLYASFPNRIVLHATQMEPDPQEGTPERGVIYGASVEFLADEGYLTYGERLGPEASRVFSGARLTAKGLAALNKVHEAIRAPGKTVGDTLVDLGRDAARDVLLMRIPIIFIGCAPAF